MKRFLPILLGVITLTANADTWVTVPTPTPTPTPDPDRNKPSRLYYDSAYTSIKHTLDYLASDYLEQFSEGATAKLRVTISSDGSIKSIQIDPSQCRPPIYANLSIQAVRQQEFLSFDKSLKDEVGDTITCVFVFTERGWKSSPQKAQQGAAANP